MTRTQVRSVAFAVAVLLGLGKDFKAYGDANAGNPDARVAPPSCIVDHGDAQSPSDYMVLLVRILGELKADRDAFIMAIKKDGPGGFMLAGKRGIQTFDCSIFNLGRYMKSSNDDISKSADGLSRAIGTQREYRLAKLEEAKDLLDGKQSTEGAGTRAEREASNTLILEDSNKLLVASVAMGIFALISPDHKHVSITKLTRKQMIRDLSKSFGKEKTEETRSLELTAYSMLKVLKDSWKSSDEQ